jgi:hypothetical protein
MSVLRMDDSARWYLFSLFPFWRYQKTIHARSSLKKKVHVPSFSHLQHKDKIIQKEAITSIIHGEWFGLLIHRHWTQKARTDPSSEVPIGIAYYSLMTCRVPRAELTSCPNPPACMSIRPAAPQAAQTHCGPGIPHGRGRRACVQPTVHQHIHGAGGHL